MAWEGGWTPARTPLAYQAEMGALWERPAQELVLAKAPPPASGRNILGGGGGRPLSLFIRVCTPGHNAPNFPQPHLQEETGSPEDWLVLAALRLGGVDSGFHAVIVVGLGSLVGREA